MKTSHRNPFKEGRWQSPEYLAYVRSQPCCGCGERPPSEPHHWGPSGVARKADDVYAVPLCGPCHRYWHDHGTLPNREPAEARQILVEAQHKLMRRWIVCL